MSERTLWQKVKRVSAPTIGIALTAVGCNQNAEQPKLPLNSSDLKPGSQAASLFDEDAIILPFPGKQRYVQGPHNTGLNPNGKKDGFDISPIDIIPCSESEDKIYQKEPLISMVTGVVTEVGNEKKKSDPLHSVVEVQRKDGLRVRQLHVSKLADGIEEGKQIKAGETIGWAGCEKPPGGRTDLIHSHVYFIDKTGEPLELVNIGREISGYSFTKDGQLIS